jgi:SAM-dependent methyltransferase
LDFDRYATNYREILDRNVAASGESGEYFAKYKARYLARVLGRDFAGRILDYGCGIGLVTAELSKLLPLARFEGFDESAASIANVNPELGKRARFFTDLADVGVADVIVVANVLHHVPPADRPSLMIRLSGKLATGGRLAIFEHNPKNPVTVSAVRDCPFDEDAVLLQSGEAVNLCASSGLSILRKDYIVFFPHMLAWLRSLEPGLWWLPIGAQYAVLAQKS